MITDEERKVRQKLFEDFEYWAANCAYIRTKRAQIVPLVLNRAQKTLLWRCYRQLKRRGYIRLVILKGRQMGSSTFVEAFLYWWVSQREAQKALVVAHDKIGTQTIFTMTKRLHNKMPDIMRPSTERSSTTELVFDKLDSAYRIATAGGEGIVRGDTLTAVHLSEVAWWPKGSSEANYSGLMDALPIGEFAEGTVAFEESTANGFNLFYEHCRRARLPEGDPDKSDWEFVFLPWYWDQSCEAPVPEGFTRTPGEIELAALVLAETMDELTDRHLMFRRLKIAEKGEDLFKQEYPSTPDEAFLTSGAPVFNTDRIRAMQEAKREPIARMSLMPSKKWEKTPLGELRVYLPHSPSETYFIGADVGKGVKKDASVAQVLDSKRRQAAVWYSARHDADWFGTVCAKLAEFYNDAYLAIELNGPGILANRVMHIDEEYSNFHRTETYDKITDEMREEVGFGTTEKTKPLIIEELRAVVRTSEIEIYDPVTLHEMERFIVGDNGKYQAEEGHHDDHVMALAIANHVNDGEWKPYKNEDSWYVSSE